MELDVRRAPCIDTSTEHPHFSKILDQNTWFVGVVSLAPEQTGMAKISEYH